MERRSTDLAPPTTAGGAEPPNILLLFTDQQRADALGCSGNPFIQTPNLDRLASEGIRFSQAVTTTPVCIASRYSLITGLRMPRASLGGECQRAGGRGRSCRAPAAVAGARSGRLPRQP